MALYKSLGELVSSVAAMVRPPERLTVAEAAETYVFLNNPGSYVGQWDNSFAPYLVEPMEVLTSDQFQGMIFAGPVRAGKSAMCLNWITHSAICDPADTMVVHMTQNSARDWSQGDLRKAIRNTPILQDAVMPGRQNQNTHDIRFKSEMLLLVKWPTISELSGKTIPRLWLIDYDRMPQDVAKEGSPYDLASKRAVSFRRYGMTVAESTPGFEVTDPKWIKQTPHQAPPTLGILSLYNRGDRRRWYWRCVHCGQPFEPDFSLITYPDTKDINEAAEGAAMVCPHCGALHMPEQKHECNLGGKWVPDNMRLLPDGSLEGRPLKTNIASFWLKGPAAAFASWESMVSNYLRAEQEYLSTGSQEALKVTTNTDQGLPYTPKGLADERLPEGLKDRAVPLVQGEVPLGVRYITTTIDVQKNSWVVQVHGHKEGDDVVIIDRFKVIKSNRLDPDGERYWVNPGAYPEDWDLLTEQVLLASYPLSDGSGRRMAVKAVACDSGGREGVTVNAYEYWRRLRDDPEGRQLHRRFRLVKGASRKGAPRVKLSYPDSSRADKKAGARGEVPVLILNTDLIKDAVDQRLNRTDPKGGMYIFPEWLEDWWYKELVAEQRSPQHGWANPGRRRNEAWDLLCYDYALGISTIINAEHIDWAKPPSWASDWDTNDLVMGENVEHIFEVPEKISYNLDQLGDSLG